jgi:hypothetical protein
MGKRIRSHADSSFAWMRNGGHVRTARGRAPTPFSNGGPCVKLCEFDNTPGDPDCWKVAERRCNYNQRGAT